MHTAGVLVSRAAAFADEDIGMYNISLFSFILLSVFTCCGVKCASELPFLLRVTGVALRQKVTPLPLSLQPPLHHGHWGPEHPQHRSGPAPAVKRPWRFP